MAHSRAYFGATGGQLRSRRIPSRGDYVSQQGGKRVVTVTSRLITSFAYLQCRCCAYITHTQRWLRCPMQSMPCRPSSCHGIAFPSPSACHSPATIKLYVRQGQLSSIKGLFSVHGVRVRANSGLFGFVIYLPCSRFDLKWVQTARFGAMTYDKGKST